LIFLAFFIPVAIYLLVLGGINRRRYPLMVSGVFDFIGLLFAASGFLLVGGPAILSIFARNNDRWRTFWLLGNVGSWQLTSDELWQGWLFLAGVYFVFVITGSAYLLWRQRALTSIYNVEPIVVERCLERVFERLRLNPVRSGNMYLFGLAGEPAVPKTKEGPEGPQGPHYLPLAITTRVDPGSPSTPEGEFLGQTAVLEVEGFVSMRHVTLRWDPVDNLFRREVESQLQEVLARTPSSESELGAWMLVIGMGMLALLFLGGIAVLLVRAWLVRD
jgi:hypothetical protein